MRKSRFSEARSLYGRKEDAAWARRADSSCWLGIWEQTLRKHRRRAQWCPGRCQWVSRSLSCCCLVGRYPALPGTSCRFLK